MPPQAVVHGPPGITGHRSRHPRRARTGNREVITVSASRQSTAAPHRAVHATPVAGATDETLMPTPPTRVRRSPGRVTETPFRLRPAHSCVREPTSKEVRRTLHWPIRDHTTTDSGKHHQDQPPETSTDQDKHESASVAGKPEHLGGLFPEPHSGRQGRGSGPRAPHQGSGPVDPLGRPRPPHPPRPGRLVPGRNVPGGPGSTGGTSPGSGGRTTRGRRTDETLCASVNTGLRPGRRRGPWAGRSALRTARGPLPGPLVLWRRLRLRRGRLPILG